MLRLFERSLLLRLGIAMAGITMLALVGMGSSVIIAEMMRGEATAINQAGSLRMQSYWIATRLLSVEQESAAYTQGIEDAMRGFEDRLHSPRLVDALPRGRGNRLRSEHNSVAVTWAESLKPMLAAYVADSRPGSPSTELQIQRDHLVTMLGGYVQEVDQLVRLLEEDAESKINLLRLLQGFSLFLTFAVAYSTMYLVYRDALTPLKDLLAFAERARRGDFSRRPQHTGEDELGQLGRAFDVMAEDLSKLYADLESRVAEKTADLERSNRSLELLYNVSNRLSQAPVSVETYTDLLREIEKLVGLGPGSICVADEPGTKPAPLATTAGSAGLCDVSRCTLCMQQDAPRLHVSQGDAHLLSVPLRDQEGNYGVLLLNIPHGREPEPWQIQLVDAIGRHIGIAIGTAQRATQSRRLALFEERSVIARELHDSLAQSLSYLKIQLGRLRLVLPNGTDGGIDAVMQEMRAGVNDAYRQLRELLTTFRLKMDGRGLQAALEDTGAEFARRGGILIASEHKLQGCPLSVNEEIHVLQIVREALSNVLRHADAAQAQVRLTCDAQGVVTVTIDDDGVGVDPLAARQHHYGIAIMQERARSLGGEIQLERRENGGTRVALRFVPVSRQRAA
jgi:two-component system nitrate/nitrite sensor histidine kinase NarX